MFVCVFAKKFPALASQSCCEVSRPRAVGEYEYRLFPIKQRGDNTCMIDFAWHHCKNKKGFKTYTCEKLEKGLSEYSSSFPMMSTQELVDWARACHPNVSIHAYDATYCKFMKHMGNPRDISLFYFLKAHHYYPIRDERLQKIATKANQEGADNL